VPPPVGGGGTGGGGNPTEASWCGALRTMQQKCQTCHQNPPIYGAPLPLMTHADTQKPWGTGKVWNAMKAAVESGRMPQTTTLTAVERATLDRWFAEGAPSTTEQCQNVTPPPETQAGPEYLPCPQSEQKVFRTRSSPTDVNSTGKYSVPGGTVDKYVRFPFPSPFKAGEQAIAWAPIIDQQRVIHHYILYGTTAAGSTRNGTFVAGWAPGGVNTVMAPDLGLVLDFPHFYLEIHYNNPAGSPNTSDSSGVAFCTVPAAQARPNRVGIVTLGSIKISIPPGARNQAVVGTCNNLSANGRPLTIVAGSAHMHKTGTGFTTDHFGLNGASRGLITNVPIGTWNFENQKPQPLPSRRVYNPNERLVTTCYYNNTGSSPVTFGEGTTDEMCFDFMSVYPIEDANKLCVTFL
jgi:predicted DNA-binding transcriptional regulator AlpA